MIAFAACTTEDANVADYEAQVIDRMTDTDFIKFMETIAIDRGALPYELSPDDSVYPFPIESIIAVGEEKNLIVNPSNGVCVEKSLRVGDELVAEFEIEKFADNNGVGNGAGNGNQKLSFKYTAQPGWYIYSISMNIEENCDSTPLYNGEPDICAFNIRNCFSGRRTGVTYTFADNCIPECSCTAAYVVVYNLDANGCVDQCVGVWVDGDQLAGSATATSNSFCKSDCGDAQDN